MEVGFHGSGRTLTGACIQDQEFDGKNLGRDNPSFNDYMKPMGRKESLGSGTLPPWNSELMLMKSVTTGSSWLPLFLFSSSGI
jgi:hypothetical protein